MELELNNDMEIVSDSIFINLFENFTLNINLSTIDINSGSILTLEIYPENNWHKADGFDDCVMGIVHSFSGESILAYDYYKIIIIMMIKRQFKNIMNMERIQELC